MRRVCTRPPARNGGPGLVSGRPQRAWPAATQLPLGPGQPGAAGINRVLRTDGSVQTLAHIDEVQMQPGDVFEIQTPGGGGFGRP